MQVKANLDPPCKLPPGCLRVETSLPAFEILRNPRARRYILRVLPNRVIRLTLPRTGTVQGGLDFLRRHTRWIQRQLASPVGVPPVTWVPGMRILFRGQWQPVKMDPDGDVWVGGDRVGRRSETLPLQAATERSLWALARRELPPRVLALAQVHGFLPRRVSVRNQCSRWGSCSRRGTISLNWRLVQTPDWVRDYVILHELAHLRHMNHSRAFWEELAGVCPDYLQAKAWIKRHRGLMAGWGPGSPMPPPATTEREPDPELGKI